MCTYIVAYAMSHIIQVNLTSDQSLTSVSLPAQDKAAMSAIEHDWRVGHRLSLGMQRDDGSICRAKEIVFAKGDFVEVSVYADIVVFVDTKTKTKRIDVQFAPQEMIKLWSAKDARVREHRFRMKTSESDVSTCRRS